MHKFSLPALVLTAGLTLSGCAGTNYPTWLGGDPVTSQSVCQKAQVTLTAFHLGHKGAATLLDTAAINRWIVGANATKAAELLKTSEDALEQADKDEALCKPIADQLDAIAAELAQISTTIPTGAPK